MASFAKDISTPIKIPTVAAPDFASNTSTVQDIASIASFGIAVSDRIEAKEKELTRQEVQKDSTAFVDTLVLDYQNMTSQPGGRAKALRSIQKKISERGTPLQSSFLSSEFGRRLAVQEQGINLNTVDKPPSDAFSIAGEDIKRQALAANNIGVAPAQGSVERDALNDSVNQITTIQMTYATNKKLAENAKTVSKGKISDLDIAAQNLINTQGAPLVTQMTEFLEQSVTLPSGERLAVLNNLRESATIAKQQFVGFIENTYAGIESSKVKTNKEENLKSIDNLFKPFEEADDEAFGRNAKNLDFLSNSMQLGLLNAGNVLAQVKQTYGAPIPELFWGFLNANKKLGESFTEAIGNQLGFTAAQSKVFDLNALQQYVNGGGSIDEVGEVPFTPEQRALFFETGFKYYDSKTKNGELLNLDKVDANTSADAMIHILQDASAKDSTTNSNIMGWVSDPNFQQMLTRVDKDKAEAIGNMIVTKSKTDMRSGDGPQTTISKFPQFYKFNVGKGEFELSEKGKSLPVGSGGLLGGTGTETLISRREAHSSIKNANRDLKVFLDNAKANPGLSTLTKQKQLSWFMKEGAGIPLSEDVEVVNGNFVPTFGVEAEAIDQQVSAQELEKQRKDVEDRIAKEADIANQVVELQNQLKEARSAGTTPKTSVDVEDMSDDEKLEFIKQIQNTISKPTSQSDKKVIANSSDSVKAAFESASDEDKQRLLKLIEGLNQ